MAATHHRQHISLVPAGAATSSSSSIAGGQKRQVSCDAAKLLDCEAALTQGANGQEDGDNELAGRQVVDYEAMEIEGEDGQGEGLTKAPEDVGGGDGGEGVGAEGEVSGEEPA